MFSPSLKRFMAVFTKLQLSSLRTKVCAAQQRENTIASERKNLRWLNRVMQDHEARASDLNRKLILSFFLLFSYSKLLEHNKQGPKFTVQQSPLISRLLVSN